MGWVCLQVTQRPWAIKRGAPPPTHRPTSLSHCCIHKWRGCDRTARRAHRPRSACGRISPWSRLCTCQPGRPRRCQSCYHMFRKRRGILRGNEGRRSGLGDKLRLGGPPPLTPHSLLSEQNSGPSRGRLWMLFRRVSSDSRSAWGSSLVSLTVPSRMRRAWSQGCFLCVCVGHGGEGAL